MSNEWLSELKAGDKVIYGGGRWDGQGVVSVSKITKTLIICGHLRFRKTDGSALHGTTWNRVFIKPYSEEMALKIEAILLTKELSERIASSKLPSPPSAPSQH